MSAGNSGISVILAEEDLGCSMLIEIMFMMVVSISINAGRGGGGERGGYKLP